MPVGAEGLNLCFFGLGQFERTKYPDDGRESRQMLERAGGMHRDGLISGYPGLFIVSCRAVVTPRFLARGVALARGTSRIPGRTLHAPAHFALTTTLTNWARRSMGRNRMGHQTRLGTVFSTAQYKRSVPPGRQGEQPLFGLAAFGGLARRANAHAAAVDLAPPKVDQSKRAL